MEGKFSDLKRVFQHFDSTVLTKVPIEGKVLSSHEGGHFFLGLRPGPNRMGGSISGHLVEGGMETENGQVVLEDCSINFDYTSRTNRLLLTDLAGKVWVGEGESREVYTLSCRNTFIDHFPRPTLNFDVRVEDLTHDLIRLAGQGRASDAQRREGVFEIQLDPRLTTIGRLHPNITQLAIRDWKEVVALRAEPVVELETLLDDLHRFSHTGWFMMSSGEVDLLKDIEVEGSLRGAVSFDPVSSTYNFSAVGNEVVVDGHPIEAFFLNGKRTASKWSIEQLQMDRFSLSADLFPRGNRWDLGFVGVEYGTALLLGLEGTYMPTSRDLAADIRLLELDLDHVEELELFATIAHQWLPKGKVRGSGTLNVTLPQGETPQVDITVESTVAGLEIAGVGVTTHEPFQVHFDSSSGVRFENLEGRVDEVYGLETDLKIAGVGGGLLV